MGWCNEEFSKLVVAVCNGLATSQAQHDCGKRELADVSDYFIRKGPIECDGVSDSAYRQECYNQAFERWERQFYGLWEVWPKVRHAANGAPAVVEALRDVVTCLEALGYEQIDTELLFQWQRFDDPDTFDQREEGYTPEQKAARSELAEPADQCARQTGYYAAQDVAWTAEVERLYQEEPELAQPLRNEGILEILRGPETAPFLTLR